MLKNKTNKQTNKEKQTNKQNKEQTNKQTNKKDYVCLSKKKKKIHVTHLSKENIEKV